MPASKNRKLIEEVRTQVARVRERLLNPCAGMLEPMLEPMLETVLPELQQAIHLLQESDVSRQGEESPRRLYQELALVKALAKQANEFYSMRIRLLAPNDSSVCYSRNGLAAGSSAEAPQPQGESVLHG